LVLPVIEPLDLAPPVIEPVMEPDIDPVMEPLAAAFFLPGLLESWAILSWSDIIEPDIDPLAFDPVIEPDMEPLELD